MLKCWKDPNNLQFSPLVFWLHPWCFFFSTFYHRCLLWHLKNLAPWLTARFPAPSLASSPATFLPSPQSLPPLISPSLTFLSSIPHLGLAINLGLFHELPASMDFGPKKDRLSPNHLRKTLHWTKPQRLPRKKIDPPHSPFLVASKLSWKCILWIS